MTHDPARDDDGLHDLIARARRDRERRQHGFRARALALFPPVCARCGRDFEGRALHDLTVHHRDHNHEHNPPDGSNWELLCVSCHEREHARNDAAAAHDAPPVEDAPAGATYQPFANLDALLKKKP
jgi:5-methylcytosine-specific restriction endonuclease McrA